LVVCIRTPFKGRKWPWVLFILVGIGRIAVNWSTGDWFISPVHFQLLGASISAPFYGPWTVAVSIPLGAIMFLIMRNSLRAVKDGSQLTASHEVPGTESQFGP